MTSPFKAMKNLSAHLLLLLLLTAATARADEGMWLLNDLAKPTRSLMKELGFKLSPKELYSLRKPSLKDGVVSFGGFCTGVVVSADGLVLTNHHCGFEQVQRLSSAEHDLVTNGFAASDREGELPCPGLYVRFLLRTDDVSDRILSALTPTMTEDDRLATIDSIGSLLREEALQRDSTLIVELDTYYGGTSFSLSQYRDYDDVRLVFAPPASVGKFGWDTDNWEWPRHTGDFCVFRIYARPDGQPASYAEDNVPYHPPYVVPISMDGYREGDPCMTIGYPGTTDRYLSSYGIEERVNVTNQTLIDVRGIRQAIWKREMNRRPDINLKYASKYDQSSNYWKNAIGMNQSVSRLRVIERRRDLEAQISQYLHQSPTEDPRLLELLPRLQAAYAARQADLHALTLLIEALMEGVEANAQVLRLLMLDPDDDSEVAGQLVVSILEDYADIDLDIDREVFAAMLKLYRTKVTADYLPDFYQRIDTLYGGSCQAFVDSLYTHSELVTSSGLNRVLAADTTFRFYQDPAIDVTFDLLSKAFEIQSRLNETDITRDERLLTAVLRRMYPRHDFYPDANSTMRLSLGSICGYRARDAVYHASYTTTTGLLQKVRDHRGDPDFEIQSRLHDLLTQGSFGPYADASGEMHVCFISNNDITGGNSGSPMFDRYGRLIGLAFDGNWEAMSGDLLFEPQTQRCIGVDIRYVLFIIDRYAGATNLVSELLQAKSGR